MSEHRKELQRVRSAASDSDQRLPEERGNFLSFLRRRFRFAVIGVLALLALCACNAGSQIVVHPDGSGTFSTVLSVQGSAGEALYKSVLKAEARSKVPLKVSRYSNGSESGAQISAPFKSLNDLTALGNNLGSSTGLAGVVVTRASSGWTFVARSDGGLVRPPGSATGSTGGGIDGSQLAGLISMSVSVELPGAPGKTNADTVTHTATTSRFVWNLTAGRPAADLSAATTFVGNQRSVTLATALTALKNARAGGGAVSAAGPESSPGGVHGRAVLGIGVGGLVLLAGGAGGLILIRARRSRAA